MDVTGSGHPISSENEVLEALSMILHRMPRVILVIDGVDECRNPQEFLSQLHSACQGTPSRLLLLCRPSVIFPGCYRQASGSGGYMTELGLSSSRNCQDIAHYLRPKIEDLLRSGLLDGKLPSDFIVEAILSRANRMFLWTELVVQYLGCFALSPDERTDAILNLNLLEGLESLYSKILQLLRTRFPAERELCFLTFQFLSVVLRPMNVDEIQSYLIVHSESRGVSKPNAIPNFEETLRVTSGGLLEIRCDKVIGFIQTSVIEFLTSHGHCNSEFYISLKSANLSVARVCVSYLRSSGRPGPLSGTPEEPISRSKLQKSLPLVAYACQFWPTHAAEALRSLNRNDSNYDFILCLSKFLSDHLRMTGWLEAIWVMGVSNDVEVRLRGAAMARYIFDHPGSYLLAKAVSVCEEMEKLSIELQNLRQDWSQVLKSYPNKVWGDTVSAYGESKFFFRTPATRVDFVRPNAHSTRRSILITSQVSQDGSRIGIIKVLPNE